MALTGLTKVTNIGINTTTIPTLGGSRNTGVVTATNFIGDGSGLSNVTGSGAGVIVRDGGSLVCLLYTSPSPRDRTRSRMPSSA